MKKKILAFVILSIFMLVTISMATSVNIKNQKEEKISPLFKIRTKQVLNNGEKEKIRKRIIDKIFENRIIFIPLFLFKKSEFKMYQRPLVTKGGLTSCPSFDCICMNR